MLRVRHNAHSVRKIYLSKDRKLAFGTDFQPKFIFSHRQFCVRENCKLCTRRTNQPNEHMNERTGEREQNSLTKGKSKDEVQHLSFDVKLANDKVHCTTEKENNCPELWLQCTATDCIACVERLSCFPLHDILYLS